MQIIVLLTFLFIAVGAYQIVIGQLDLVTKKAVKAAHAYHKNNTSSNEMEAFIESLAVKVSKYIRLDTYKKKKMESELKSLQITSTPEVYQARNLVKTGFILMGVIPCLLIAPILAIGVVVGAVFVYLKCDTDLKEQLRKKREEIEYELPRFASTLKQELTSSRDVLSILDNYKKNAGESMKNELEKTVADMRSGNYEAALLRFESRVSLPALSDIVRGLIGVLRGDNNVNYFEMLSHDLDVLEVQRLENLAGKQPGKIKKYILALLICMMVMYITILAVYAAMSI
ncbi:hypothetical protein acsn021_11170 [Anaerocolumna cellulosilytica]|uniref:Uncharacterized protein n=1 Tax=Anaerocolumna cellulosilytica TaxID=433286 RepID=A0A6S6R3C8_9FIRM|nr:secretion protein F [Anaerocolumna cellulosilytica]MBB5194604.1 Flp pilus assembly protein TadB [Anaerocolumna cellulosilytica]BCJ93548.1 hypothetical protein acsn021_11170 [Anaerocolumna cellulosilytica]